MIPIGIATDNAVFWILGIAFLATGLANKSKWTEKKDWKKLSKKDRKLQMITFIMLGILVLAALAMLLVN